LPSQEKLIKQGIKYTDSLFAEISKRIEQGVLSTDTLEDFLDKYHKAYPDNGNPLVTLGYDKEMVKLILSETNNHKFTRPAQKELVRVTIENRVGDNIVDVGDEIRDSVRDIVKDGYNQRLSQDEIAENISSKVTGIKNRRARAIARTEIARAATVSDYIINKEMGATHFYVECRNTACPVCKNAWHNKWTPENDSSFNPSDTSAGGKGWIGDKTYSMNDTKMLPPLHPNCRCVPYFINDGSTSEPNTREPTREELSNNLTASERAKYANYKRSIQSHEQWLRDNPNASEKAISGHRKRLEDARRKLEELRVKAIGGVEAPVVQPAPEPTPEPKQPKPKTTPKEPEPKAEPKPKPKPQREPVPISEPKTPTREQLDKNLTQKERKEYKDIEYEIKWANDILNKASSTDKQKAYAKTRLDAITPRFNELSNKALGLTPKRTRKSSKTKRKTKKTKEPVQLDKPKNARLTKEECDSLTFEQLAEHHNATYKGLVKIAEDGNKEYHVFEQTFDNGETFKLHFEKGAVNSYNKEGIASANEIIHESFKVPELLRKETNELWFRNTQKTVAENKRGTGFRSFANNEGGLNTSTNKKWYDVMKRMGKDVLNDPNHRIAINPKYFKKLKSFGDIINWRDRPQKTTSWKHAIHHEFIHSIDTNRDIWKNDKTRLCSREEYLEIERAEPDFTVYAHEKISESYAEHGGYISYMLANPEEQSKKITILSFERDEKGRRTSFNPIQEEIDFEEYKRRFPKHYEYFTKLLEEGVVE